MEVQRVCHCGGADVRPLRVPYGQGKSVKNNDQANYPGSNPVKKASDGVREHKNKSIQDHQVVETTSAIDEWDIPPYPEYRLGDTPVSPLEPANSSVEYNSYNNSEPIVSYYWSTPSIVEVSNSHLAQYIKNKGSCVFRVDLIFDEECEDDGVLRYPDDITMVDVVECVNTVEYSTIKVYYTQNAQDVVQDFVLVSDLNGTNGEYTDTDDTPPPKRGHGKKGKQPGVAQIIADINRLRQDFSKMKTKPKPKARGRAGGQRQRSGSSNVSSGAHPVVMNVLQRFVNPTERNAPKVGLPKFPSENSLKARGFMEFDVSIGTSGGFVVVNPSMANDGGGIVFSNNSTTFVGTVIPANGSAPTGGTQVSFTNLPFASASFNANTLLGRLVCVGIEAQYTGTKLNESGMVYSISSTDNTQDITGLGPSTLTALEHCVVDNCARGKLYHCSMHPTSNIASDYTSSSLNQWNSTATESPIGMWFTGVAANGAYHVRVTLDVELIGSAVQNNATPNPIAPAGAFEHVCAIASKARAHHSKNPSMKPKELVKLAQTAYGAVNKNKGSIMDAGMAVGML